MIEGNERPFAGSFFIYAENWAPYEKVASSGLDRALVPIIGALRLWTPVVLLAPRRAAQLRHPLHPTIKPYAERPSLISVILDERRAKREADYDGEGRTLSAHLRTTRGETGVLFSVLGGDARAYVRASKLASRAGLKHVIYSVDDPFAWADERAAVRPKLATIKPTVHEAFQRAAAVLTITPDLAGALSIKTGRECHALALPYVETPVQVNSLKRQLIYVGTMSHLYGDSFVQVVEAVVRRRAAGDDLRLRATFLPDALEGLLPTVPDFVDLGRIDDRSAFLTEIAESLAAVCPISFDPAQEMVRTSFPSKLLDYLCNARSIVVHGPAESVASRYLADADLPYVSSCPKELDAVLKLISEEQPDLRARYRERLDAAHGSEQFRATLQSVVSGIPIG